MINNKLVEQIILTEYLSLVEEKNIELNQAQVLCLLDISRNTLKKWVDNKLISKYKKEGKWYFSYSDIQSFLDTTLVSN